MKLTLVIALPKFGDKRVQMQLPQHKSQLKDTVRQYLDNDSRLFLVETERVKNGKETNRMVGTSEIDHVLDEYEQSRQERDITWYLLPQMAGG